MPLQRSSQISQAFVFGLVGGILILAGALIFLPFVFSPYGYYGPFFFGIFGLIIGLVSGVLVILGATMGFLRPDQGVPWGIVMVVFGAASLFGLGGFLIGMALAVVGGALAIVSGSSGTSAGAGMQRACTSCGMLIDMRFSHCPHCGHAIGMAPR